MKATPLSDDPDAVENLLLLCGVHHPIVDNNPRIYSVEVLAKFKADHEARMAPPQLKTPLPVVGTEWVDLSLLTISVLPGAVWRAKVALPDHRGGGRPPATPARWHASAPVCVASQQRVGLSRSRRASGPVRNQAVDRSTSKRLDAGALQRSDDRNLYVWLLNSGAGDRCSVAAVSGTKGTTSATTSFPITRP